MARAKIIDKDKGWDRIKKEIQASRNKPHVRVGIFGEKAAADHGGTPNIKVAAAHELGARIKHPGGTPYIVDKKTGKAKFVSKAAAAGKNLPVTEAHEITIPERSFIRATVDAKTKEIAKTAKRLATAVVAGTQSRAQALDVLGQYVKGLMQARISAGIPPPLKPATIRRKGSSKPLIDTGQLRASIDYLSRPNGGGSR